MPDFCGLYCAGSSQQKKIKIFLKKCLTFLEYKFIVYGLSKLGRRKTAESNLWMAE